MYETTSVIQKSSSRIFTSLWSVGNVFVKLVFGIGIKGCNIKQIVALLYGFKICHDWG